MFHGTDLATYLQEKTDSLLGNYIDLEKSDRPAFARSAEDKKRTCRIGTSGIDDGSS